MVFKVEGVVLSVRSFTNKETGEVTPVADLLIHEEGQRPEVAPVYCRDQPFATIKALEGKRVAFKVWGAPKSLSLQESGISVVDTQRKAS